MVSVAGGLLFRLFGDLTYALEYTFGIKNVIAAVLVVSGDADAVFSLLGWLLKYIQGKFFMPDILIAAVLASFAYIHPLLSNLPEYMPRLGMLLDNAVFILGVDQNME